MFIQPEKPFAITKDDDGSIQAVKDGLAVTVTSDLGDVKVNHRIGNKPITKEESRWLHVDVQDYGIHLFINGPHILLTKKDYLPTFDLKTPDDIMNEAFRYLKIEKDEKGRYIIDTENNRKVLKVLMDEVSRVEKGRLLSWMKHLAAKLMS